MTIRTEQQLKDLFKLDASRAPTAAGLADAARRRVRHRRRRHLAWASSAGVAAVLVGTSVAVALTVDRPSPRTLAPPIAAWSGPSRVGALPDGGIASCPWGYSPAFLPKTAFAFDGTVVEIGSVPTGSGVAVTFRVNQWFRGGDSPESVAVGMLPPTSAWDSDGVGRPNSTYGVGTRLLVSGAPRWGGAPLDDPVAWGCGFTRYYDTDTAEVWRNTLS